MDGVQASATLSPVIVPAVGLPGGRRLGVAGRGAARHHQVGDRVGREGGREAAGGHRLVGLADDPGEVRPL
ncbi:hypothetical protein NKG94_22560 [Micromonospora sp. M12]